MHLFFVQVEEALQEILPAAKLVDFIQDEIHGLFPEPFQPQEFRQGSRPFFQKPTMILLVPIQVSQLLISRPTGRGFAYLARTGQELASRYAAPLTIWPLVALLYLALTFPLTRVAEYLERRWRPVTRA